MSNRGLAGYLPGLLAAATVCGVHGSAAAHFVLQSPPALTEQSPLGDPQKAPPCGDDGSATATDVVTTYQAGETITITIDETITHPGHYRIALAVDDPSQLPPEPLVTPGDTPCGSAPIDPAPVFPVLADGVFVHTEALAGPQSIEVTLPSDVNCTNCTLQIIQFMSNHALNNPGGCYYHHCAAIAIEGGVESTTGAGSSSSGDPTTSGSPVTTDPGVTTDDSASGTTAGDDTGDTSGGAGDSSSGGTTAAVSTTVTVETDSGQGDDDSDSGCSCSSAPDSGQAPFATMLTLLGLIGLRVRRRR